MQQPLRESPKPAPKAEAHASSFAEPWQATLRNVAIAAGAGVFLAFVGALGTDRVGLPIRLLYWVPLMLAGSLIAHGATLLLQRLRFANNNPWLFGALLTLAMALPITAAVWVYSGMLLDTRFSTRALPELFGSVLSVCTAMTAVMLLVNWPGRVTHAPAAGAPAPTIRFLERLPAKLKGAIVFAVSSEDHYLRLHTSKGSDLILMRLSDAISELEGLEGAQVHRSWWVARDAVERARRDGDRVTLVLKGGVEAPVSRPNIRPLREAGWF